MRLKNKNGSLLNNYSGLAYAIYIGLKWQSVRGILECRPELKYYFSLPYETRKSKKCKPGSAWVNYLQVLCGCFPVSLCQKAIGTRGNVAMETVIHLMGARQSSHLVSKWKLQTHSRVTIYTLQSGDCTNLDKLRKAVFPSIILSVNAWAPGALAPRFPFGLE